jgi:F0F1-type ATP synthase membrane subunit b/b'
VARESAAKITHDARAEAKQRVDAARSATDARTAAEMDQLAGQVGAVSDLFVQKLTKQRVGL